MVILLSGGFEQVWGESSRFGGSIHQDVDPRSGDLGDGAESVTHHPTVTGWVGLHSHADAEDGKRSVRITILVNLDHVTCST
jgi:hypothetical protein